VEISQTEPCDFAFCINKDGGKTMTIFYFTATGNSLAVAKRIGGNLISIPQVINERATHYKDDAIGVIFPVYSNAPPKMIRRFLDKVSFEAEYLFAIGTYGNLPGACMYNVQKQAEKKGYRFDYPGSLLMVDNFLPVFEIDAQIAKLPKKETEKMTAKIVDDIKNRRKKDVRAGPAVRALAAILNATTKTDKNAQNYIVNDQCVKCGVCAKVCPAKNIAVTDKVCFSDRCEACLACVHLCPQNAIHLKNEKSNARWRNPDVSLEEIIAANQIGQ
jgi:Pyruvate/2-oxoacid:ferredoxin oxidoreductase delta subunit